MSIYQKRHHEDVAHILNQANLPIDLTFDDEPLIPQIVVDFADLFAADNHACCTHCGALDTTMVCVTAGGRCYEEHNFEGGFDREWFLKACEGVARRIR